MSVAIFAAFTTLIGVLLGGGVRAWEANRARSQEAISVLSALCAEVEAITRLMNHRAFLAGLVLHRDMNAALVAEGKGGGPAQWLTIDLKQNYFVVYDALTPKLGLLNPYYADRITRFYTYVKAVSENYTPDSVWQTNNTAALAVAALSNDIELLQTVHLLGPHIAGFRQMTTPKGVTDPFPTIIADAQGNAQDLGAEPPLAALEGPSPPSES